MTRTTDKTFRFDKAEGPMILIHAGAGDRCGETPKQVEWIHADLENAVQPVRSLRLESAVHEVGPAARAFGGLVFNKKLMIYSRKFFGFRQRA